MKLKAKRQRGDAASPHPSLISRLIAWQALALLLAWLVLAALITWQALQVGHEEIKERLQQQGRILAEAASASVHDEAALPQAMLATEQALLKASGRDLLGELGTPLYQVWSRDGRLLYRSAKAPSHALAPRIEAKSQAKWGGQAWLVRSMADSQGRLTLQIAEAESLSLKAVLPVLAAVLQGQLGVFLWHGLVIWISVRSGLAPLRQLAQRISQRRAGDLAPVQVDRLYAETAPVLKELNELLAHEAQRLEAERRFLADAAHELRTPLAAVNAQAHLLLSEQDAQSRNSAANALKQGIARVSHLLSQLLSLAKAEAQQSPWTASPLDAADLLRGRVALLAGLARPRGVELSLQAPDKLPFNLEREGFCSIVDNLIDNAIRYTAPGGRVEVTLEAAEDSLIFCVRDDGRGIAEAQRERVFERFYRIPGSSEQGTGLGLAIVKRVADRMQAELDFVAGLNGRGVGLRLHLAPDRGAGASPGAGISVG